MTGFFFCISFGHGQQCAQRTFSNSSEDRLRMSEKKKNRYFKDNSLSLSVCIFFFHKLKGIWKFHDFISLLENYFLKIIIRF